MCRLAALPRGMLTCLWPLFGHARALTRSRRIVEGRPNGSAMQNDGRKMIQGVDIMYQRGVHRCGFAYGAACSGGSPPLPPPSSPLLTRLCFVFSPLLYHGVAAAADTSGSRAPGLDISLYPATCGIQGQRTYFPLCCFYCL